jgi:hypothetical protein
MAGPTVVLIVVPTAETGGDTVVGNKGGTVGAEVGLIPGTVLPEVEEGVIPVVVILAEAILVEANITAGAGTLPTVAAEEERVGTTIPTPITTPPPTTITITTLVSIIIIIIIIIIIQSDSVSDSFSSLSVSTLTGPLLSY